VVRSKLKRRRHYEAGATQNSQLRCLQIGGCGLAVAPIGFDVEGEFLTLNQTAHAGALDGGDMHEHIGTAAILRDEAVTLLRIEKFDSTLSHHGLLLKRIMRCCRRREPFARSPIRILRVLGNGPSKALGDTARQAKSRMALV